MELNKRKRIDEKISENESNQNVVCRNGGYGIMIVDINKMLEACT